MNKRILKKNKQWAKDAIEALEIAFQLLSEDEYKDLLFSDKQLQLLNLAPAIAAMKRGINDKKIAKKLYDFVFDRIAEDSELRDPDEELSYEIIFLLAYMDAHIFLDIFSEAKAEEIMKYIVENLKIPDFSEQSN